MSKKVVDQWRDTVTEVIESKKEEFHALGYDSVTTDDIWDCLLHSLWNGNPNKRLHEVVQDIFHLKTQTFMNYLTMQTYQDDNLLQSIEALTQNEESS